MPGGILLALLAAAILFGCRAVVRPRCHRAEPFCREAR
jgi:hypothetical protein